MSVNKDILLQALRHVQEPELHRDIVTLGMVKNIAYCDGVAAIHIQLIRDDPAFRQPLRHQIQAVIKAVASEITRVEVEFSSSSQSSSSADVPAPHRGQQAHATGGGGGGKGGGGGGNSGGEAVLQNVKHVIAVGAGKGGVGKSTVSVNLAVGLARQGFSVGLLDGDIYGPSIPTLLGIPANQPPALQGTQIIPFHVHGLKAMTIGAIVEPEKPLIWRGPMAHGAFKQLATQTDWGQLDYLIIDLPPGTGDVALTMSQTFGLAGAVIVCTPQKVAQDDARRALRMFEQLQIPVLGVVENMSYFIGDDGKLYDLFGRGGAKNMAAQMGVPFLGEIPMNTLLRQNSDSGDPAANFAQPSSLKTSLEEMVQNVKTSIDLAVTAVRTQAPTMTIS